MKPPRTVRIGGASGAWGDSPSAYGPLLAAEVDFVVMDHLAEVTMSLLARARMKDPAAGYATDAVTDLAPHLREIAARGTRVACNAGGINPRACRAALEQAAAGAGVRLRIAVVEGDDVLPLLPALAAAGHLEPVPAPQGGRLVSANAYLGAAPVAAAFDAGADIVVTGRVVDSALALGALAHAFGWRFDDPAHLDRLAAGSLVGHVLECGAQATGGLYTDWAAVPGWDHIGYPIAECRDDGSFVVTKPDGSGGLVVPASVAEQILYEIEDPAAYRLPDVVCDVTQVRVAAEGPGRVRVHGARGRAPGPSYKVAATRAHGWRTTALVVIVGVEAARKAERTAEALLARARRLFAQRGLADFSAVRVEALGAEASYGAASRTRHTREVVLRLVADHDDRAALELLNREVASSGLAFAPGTANLLGGRPKASPVLRFESFAVRADALPAPTVDLGDGAPSFAVPRVVCRPEGPDAASEGPPAGTVPFDTDQAQAGPLVEVPLGAVAHARSGDKGDRSNVAVFCRDPAYRAHLARVLTVERMAGHFAELVEGTVVRHDVPGLAAFNFVMDRALGGGGMASQRVDPLGKSYGQRALEMKVAVPAAWRRWPWP